MEDTAVLIDEREDTTQIYFTPEVLHALGIEGEVILHYGVFDFSVQLHRFSGSHVSVVLEAGDFFQKIVSTREEKAINLCVQMYNKEVFREKSSGVFHGSLESVQQLSVEQNGEALNYTEIVICLEGDSLILAHKVLKPLLRAVQTYYDEPSTTLLLEEPEVRDRLISLRFSTIHAGEGHAMRCLPHSFSNDWMTALVKAESVALDQEINLNLVLLKHQITVILKGKVIKKESTFPSVEKIQLEFSERPPLTYILFLDKLKYCHEKGKI